ncbi:MAG: hypothetical protein UX71_C0002G0048 [Parcubacteria group bacterium GW2011_GWA1_47_10]|uniref:Uncharacterized protein n=1 Tax=Candidatus Zambryskibacteria bacterium RIFCSPHIGHO2_01_FULL_46_25 TaxID=1802738 RepID=A0A1G2T063_9BACT|nr:MAG: hypothetical protein UX71_C0002G0048 [Parcubacteria group bacterium GW2011_GWA1_47_10]OHA90663.1 MAG: hypothetical protein A2838_03020 [Candidatus Zambryskibacteria bacterium RIFCSPHIGHO2_01_FULL_46_25]OHB07306.1 MAG: hypothetical protein A3A31_02160 [Candidatus Zambryskibacteria bacterium RIFCSPLOWO2_01_FULL_48_25]
MDIFLKNKSAVVAIVVLLLAFFLYSVFMSPDGVSEQTTAANPGEDLVRVAAELSNITFRQDILQGAGYRSLVDWSVAIPTEPIGRVNPFEVIGRD